MVKDEMSTEFYSDADICFGKLAKCLYIYTQQLLINVLKDLYFHHKTSADGTLSLQDFSKTVKRDDGKKNKSLKEMCGQMFPLQFKFQYDSQKEIYLDLGGCASLFRLIKNDNPIFKSLAGEALNKNFEEIVNLRNKVFHFEGGYQNLMNKLEGYKNKLISNIEAINKNMKEIFNHKEKLNCNYDEVVPRIIQDINELWALNVRESKIISVRELMKEKNNNYYIKFVSKMRLELIEYYKRLNAVPSLLLQEEKFNFGVDDIFVPPSLMVENKPICYTNILINKLGKKVIPPVVVVSGDAGHGKSTLCKKLTMDWLQHWRNEKNVKYDISNYDMLFLIEIKKATEKSLYQYLKEILIPESLESADEDDLLFFLKQLKILIIIDGFDEQSKSASHLIKSILTLMNDGKVVITTRPYYAEKIFSELNGTYDLQYLKVTLYGLDVKNNFVEKVWKYLQVDDDFKFKIENYKTYVSSLPLDFQALQKIPLINILLIYLWIGNRESFNSKYITFTNLYFEVLEHQKKNILHKRVSYEILNTQIINKWVEQLAEMCYKDYESQHSNNVMNLSETESTIDNTIISKFGENVHKEFSDVIKIFLSTLFHAILPIRKEKDIQYEFLHKTQYEYLVACHAASLLINKECILEDLFITNLEECIGEFSFLVGILQTRNELDNFVTDIIYIIKNKYSNKFNILWKILSQTLSKDDTEDFQANTKLCKFYLSQGLLQRTWALNDRNILSGFYILFYVDIIPDSLAIDIPKNVNAHKLPYFEITFRRVCKTLRKRFDKNRTKKKLEVQLHFRNLEDSTTKPVDTFLVNILPVWANLTKFSGYIEKEGIRSLKNFTNLAHIDLKIKVSSNLQNLCEILHGKNKLKKLNLYIDKSFDFETTTDAQLPELSTDYNVFFDKIEEKKCNAVFQFLKNVKPADGHFHWLSVKLDHEPNRWENFLKDLNTIVYRKITVWSKHDMCEEIYHKIAGLLDCDFRWNL